MKKIFLLVSGLLSLHLFLLANIQFTAWPEVVSFPYLFNNGFNLYGDMVHAYPPLLTIILAVVYKVFGYSLIVLKTFTSGMILLSDIFIFLIVKNLTNKNKYAILALIFYILIQPFLDGNMLWFDTALTLPILMAIYYRKNLLLAGTLLATALFIKQTALVYIFVFLAYLIYSKVGLKKILMFLTPTLFFSSVFLFWLIKSGSLIDFYNWNFYYPSTIWTKYPSYEILTLNKREIFSVLFILFPAFALLLVKFREIVKNKSFVLIFLFLVASILAIYPRFSFYHFQPALAISAVVIGIVLKQLKVNSILLCLYFLIIASLISFPLLKLNWQGETRFWTKNELELATIIESKVGKGNTVYLLGPHSLHYVLASRIPTKPWFDNFGWYFEVPGIQEETISLWENNLPEAIFIQDALPGPWYQIGTYQPKLIMSWINKNYNRVEEVAPGVWFWGQKK